MYNTYYPNYNGGQTYGVAKPQAANSQPLSVDIVNTLRQEGSEFNMKIDQRDLWRAMCTHKDPTTGQNTLAQNENGSYTCSICGKTFDFFEGATDEIKAAVKTLIDMLQSCKTIYLDAPVEMTKQYYQIIPLLEKFPGLWDMAIRNFAKYENVSNPLNPISSGYAGFNAMHNLLANPWYAQQQMYQQPMGYPQQPMMPQTPMGFQTMGYPQQPMMPQAPMGYPQQNVDMTGNPMAYGVPAQPVAPPAGVMPQAPTAAPAAPAAQNAEVQQQKVYNV